MAEMDYHIASLAGSKAVVAEDFGFFMPMNVVRF